MNTDNLLRGVSILAIVCLLIIVPGFIQQTMFNETSPQSISTSPPAASISYVPDNPVTIDHHADIPLHQITYTLDWTWGDATPNSNGNGWTVTNDLGYEIQVERGYLVNRSMELIPCPTEDTISSLILEQFLPQLAYAGHGSDDRDPSRISRPFVESLTAPTSAILETTYGYQPDYCQVHYLIAEGIETARNLPSEMDMQGISLFVEGRYRAPGANNFIPFTITAPLTWGTITDVITEIEAEKTILTVDTPISHITIRRNLATMFDEIDFARSSGEEQAKAVLRALTAGTEAIIESTP